MFKGTPELIEKRREEIINACERLYQTMSFKEITLKEIGSEELENFIYVFYPFMFGIYPYAKVTEKQKTAMKDAQVNYLYQSIYEITYNCLIRLLG